MYKKKFIYFAVISIVVLFIIVNVFFNRSKNVRDRLSEKTAKAMVLSCMDFRFVDDKVNFLNKIGYRDDYSKFVLAGSSLGYNQDTFPEWSKSFDKHIELAKDLHNIDEVIVGLIFAVFSLAVIFGSPIMGYII